MDNKRRLTNKYILLAILLIAVFVLPSCRTRISNNSEIANVQYDEDGMMSETYQERRDELGLSTAEKPLLPNLGSAETDDNDDFAEGSESIDYNPEDYQEDFSEPETTTETNTNTNTNTGTRTTTRRTPTTTRRTTGTTTSTITITFDPKEGIIEGKKKAGTKLVKTGIKKNSSITPPEATREGYTLTEWKGSDGKTVKPGGKVTVTKSTTYTAQWNDNTPAPKPKYKVTLNGEDGSSTDEVEEGGKYTLPNGAKKVGYKFVGWTTEPNGGGDFYEKGDQITVTANLDLYAYYEQKEAEEYWTEVRDDTAKGLSKKKVYLDGVGDWAKTTGVDTKDSADSADYVIAKVDDIAEAGEKAAAYTGKKVIVVSSKAEDSSESKLAYSIAVLNKLHGNKLDEALATKELLGEDVEIELMAYGF